MTPRLADARTALAAAEREAAWRDVARRLAHEIKNPLTPMSLSLPRPQRRGGLGPESARPAAAGGGARGGVARRGAPARARDQEPAHPHVALAPPARASRRARAGIRAPRRARQPRGPAPGGGAPDAPRGHVLAVPPHARGARRAAGPLGAGPRLRGAPRAPGPHAAHRLRDAAPGARRPVAVVARAA